MSKVNVITSSKSFFNEWRVYLRTLSTHMWAKVFRMGVVGKRIQLTDRLAYHLYNDTSNGYNNSSWKRDKEGREEEKGRKRFTLIFVRGGFNWKDSKPPSYLLPFCYLLQNSRILVPEIAEPVCNLSLHEEIQMVVEEGKKYGLPIVILGMSMGGVHVYNYFYHHPDEAQLYLTACSPLDLHRMTYIVNVDPFYQLVVKQTLKEFQVEKYEDLYRLANLAPEQFYQQIDTFTRMMKEMGTWPDDKRKKLISFIASNDQLTEGIFEDQQFFHFPYRIDTIDNSCHCCYNVSFAVTSFIDLWLTSSERE